MPAALSLSTSKPRQVHPGPPTPSIRQVCLIGLARPARLRACQPGDRLARSGRIYQVKAISRGNPATYAPSGGAGRTSAVTPERKRKLDRGLRDLDPSDPVWKTVELAQRGRMILDVSAADLKAAEAAFGPFHATSWHFRNALNEARASWDRLLAEFGTATFEAALAHPPLTVMAIGPDADHWMPDRSGRWPLPAVDGKPSRPILLIPIGGKTYRVARVAGTPLAPLLWRLTRLHPPLEDGPYYLCRLHDGTTQCDCADWTYELSQADPPGLCKHLRALEALGWL